MQWPSAEARTIVRHWRTRDVQEAADGLSARFAHAARFRPEGRPSAFRLQCSSAQLAEARVIRATNTGYRLHGFFDASYFVSFTARGGVSAGIGRRQVAARPHVSAIALRPGVSFDYATEPGAVVLGFEIAQSALARQAEAVFGPDFPVGERAAISDSLDVSDGHGAAFFRNVASAFNEMEALEQAGLGCVAQAGIAELLTNLALVSLFPDARAMLDRPVKSVGSGVIERARQHIEARADGPLRMSALARELGISLRALQAGFRRQLGRSPTEYLFDCRLALARQRLLSAPAGATVSAIAMECGFVNLGAFAARYRIAFGELPSQTLALRSHRRA